MADGGPFPVDALEANRAGRLSETQRKWLRSLAKNWRGNGRSIAGVAAVLGVIVLFLANRGGTERVLIGVGLLVVAGFVFVISVLGTDTMDADLRDGKVLSVEGAIAKRTFVTHGRNTSTTTYYIDVNNKQMVAFRDQYEAAPDAGYVRVYYVPHSMRVVNLEHVAAPAGAADAVKSPQDAVKLAAKGIFSLDEQSRAEARAQLAAVGGAMQPGPPPATERDARPLAEAILGKWTNGIITLEFSPDGTVAMELPGGMKRQAHWSVDQQGRLVADVMGTEEAGEAWIAGDQLSIKQGGEGIVLKRA